MEGGGKEIDDTVRSTRLLGKTGKTEEIWSGCVMCGQIKMWNDCFAFTCMDILG